LARCWRHSCYLGISMTAARQELLRLLASKSFRLGDFKLSSGASSDYYVDCRTTTLDGKGARLTGQVFLEEIRAQGWKPQAIGGLTLGADPIVTAVSVTSGEVDGFLVLNADEVRQEHALQNDETSPSVLAVGAGCEICGRPAIMNRPRVRCEEHRV